MIFQPIQLHRYCLNNFQSNNRNQNIDHRSCLNKTGYSLWIDWCCLKYKYIKKYWTDKSSLNVVEVDLCYKLSRLPHCKSYRSNPANIIYANNWQNIILCRILYIKLVLYISNVCVFQCSYSFFLQLLGLFLINTHDLC